METLCTKVELLAACFACNQKLELLLQDELNGGFGAKLFKRLVIAYSLPPIRPCVMFNISNSTGSAL